jgi:hypothetical protein
VRERKRERDRYWLPVEQHKRFNAATYQLAVISRMVFGALLVHCPPPICRRTAVFPDGENIILFLQQSSQDQFPPFLWPLPDKALHIRTSNSFVARMSAYCRTHNWPVVKTWYRCESQVTLRMIPTHKNTPAQFLSVTWQINLTASICECFFL